ncbi:DUF3618 domain-containing protein [Coralloluteibacterium thermophilus]|uniref:DUF3618 domain-containing protein n=1 Tax=Coralloluteibacterium thermophilum TaxID=2707049 RepID=A0ABV9NHC9_9GAMM
MNAHAQDRSSKDPAELEREIDRQRDHIAELVGALENRLSPGQLFERVLAYGKGGGKEFAGNLGATVRANPVPTLLTAAGLLWLYAGNDRRAAPATDWAHAAGAGSRSGHGTGDAASTAAHLRERAHDARDDIAHRLHDARHRVEDTAHDVAEGVRSGVRRASDGVRGMLEDNPMAVGAMAIAAGALLGALLPPTEAEDELLGPYSDRAADRMKAGAQAAASNAMDKAREATDGLASHDGDGRDHDDDHDRAAQRGTAGASTGMPTPRGPGPLGPNTPSAGPTAL